MKMREAACLGLRGICEIHDDGLELYWFYGMRYKIRKRVKPSALRVLKEMGRICSAQSTLPTTAAGKLNAGTHLR